MNFPRMVAVRQRFERKRIEDVDGAVREQLDRVLPESLAGRRIAVAAGSRGIRNIAVILRAVVAGLRRRGACPFLVPAMGSHGGATAAGQIEVLESLGITAAFCEAPVRSSMEVCPIGETEDGVPVYMDRHAWEDSDGVIVVNRVKPHTDFHGPYESGLMKMAAIGLGKHAQALVLHALGVPGLREVMPRVARMVLGSGKILCGIAVLENAYDETAEIEALTPEAIPVREPELLARSRALLPRLPVDDIDLLIVDAMGKDFSGTGMDTNIIGRMRVRGEPEPERPRIKTIFVRDLSAASHGNALGSGLADLTTRRLFDKIDFRVTNENLITSTFLARGQIPMVLDHDRAAVEAALRANWGVAPESARIVHIANTLELERVRVSEALVAELSGRSDIEILGAPEPLRFDAAGNLGDTDHVGRE